VSRPHAKQALKNRVYRAVGEISRLDGRRRTEPFLRVLMYHKVSPVAGNTGAVPPALFGEQMALLVERYRVVSLDDVQAHLDGVAALPPRAVLVTFDDGYRDNLVEALPLLERFGLPAVVFVPVDFVGGARPLPHDIPLLARGIVNPVVDWNDIKELARRGVTIGSHGLSHQTLSSLDPAVARDEIVRSKAILEERTGRVVTAFAYVKGGAVHFDRSHATMVADAGYGVGFSTFTGANRDGADHFRLHRYNVEPYSMRTFELVLDGRCDALVVKDSVVGDRVKRALNAGFGNAT
jgi:peptidoglycan/xylan/chitin deacetylase (PgdA/CDA1 family)